MCGHVWLCAGMCGYTWAYAGVHGCALACVGVHGRVTAWACTGVRVCASMRGCWCRYVQGCVGCAQVCGACVGVLRSAWASTGIQ